MNNRVPILPGQRNSQPQPPLFPAGTQVCLRCCPHGPAGTVLGTTRHGMIRVQWPDWHCTSRHRPSALVAADDQECRVEAPQSPQDALLGTR